MNGLLINRLLFLCNKCLNQRNRKYSFVSFATKLNKTFGYKLNVNCFERLKFCTNAQNLNKTNNENDSEVEKLLNESDYKELYPRNWETIGRKHGVLLVMPRQKWGSIKMTKDYAKYQVEETIALVNTLPNMEVIETLMISTLNINKKQVFGSGNFELLKRKVDSNTNISAVVFAINMLSSVQQSELEQQLGVDIYDRYSIVLNIFKDHARTKEAKLQIALAEIPYIRNNLRSLQNSGHSRQKTSFQHIGGLGETWIETRKQLLIERETKLKKQLEKIKLNRDILRLNRVRKQIPIVAVVGYTNSGKTSLIKALTNDEKLIPKDQLFATLDVTVHSGRLPNNLTLLYTDTIGFISQIPTALIHSFKATLSDICVADAIIHVSDISHPNWELQEETVNKTLDDIEVPLKLKNSIIQVANKIDLVEDQNILNNCNKLLVSSTKRIGLNELMDRIDKCLSINTGRLSKVLRVSNGGDEYRWLNRESAISECEADPNDNNYLFIKILITEEAFAKFKHSFRNNFTEISQ